MEKALSVEIGPPPHAPPESEISSEDLNAYLQESITGHIEPAIQEHLWAIVLAGGEGERLRSLTEKWLGCHCPKQYCTFVGNRSMLEHTLERTCRIVNADHVLTVVSCRHMKWLETAILSDIPGRVVKQPANLDTGPGIFLPATYVLAADQAATIVVFPSDHFVFPQKRFSRRVAELVTLANYYIDQIVLLGVKPDRPEADYGWIEPGQQCISDPLNPSNHPVRRVAAFREKPSTREAMRFFEQDYLWNTMIFAVRAETLWKLGQQYFPEMIGLFEYLKSSLRSDGQVDGAEAVLSSIYEELRPQNFSRGLLQRAVDQTLVVPMEDVDWDDWGRPERIVDSLSRIGLRPSFSGELSTNRRESHV